MKLNKQSHSFTTFVNIKKHMKTKSRFVLWYQKKVWNDFNPLELDKNMQLNNSSIVFKTCVPEFLTRPSFNFDDLCMFNKLVVQKYKLDL